MDTSSVAYEKKDNTLVYTSLQQICELCCIMCQTDFIEVQDSSSKSNFHWQTMKCRLLILLVPDIIASPVSGTERYIFVITYKKFFETGKLERILRSFKLVYQGVRPITTELYQNCVIFTIQTKIAPLWNKVGQYFLQGKEFYNSVEAIKAIKLDILLEGKNVCLKLHAERIKVPYIKLEDYLPSSVVSEFLANPKGYIDLSRYNFPFIYVLPSTKKGKLLSVSKQIPSKCPFKDYNQLRRHWKNMYGYSLPKNSDEVFYFEIKFLMPKSNIFIYPNLCITSGPLDIIPNREKDFIVTQFLSDMLVKLPVVCGRQLQISRHTPINAQTLNENLPTSTLLQNQEPQKYSETTSVIPSQSSEFRNKRNINGTLIKAQLTKFHQIHNTSLCENIATSSNRELQENQNDTRDIIATTEGTTSTYFRVEESQPFINKEEPTQEQNQTHLTLKEKLLKAKTNGNKVFIQEADENIDIEEMAKNSQLHQVKNSALSNWLKKHSIPHDSKGRKTYLINKVLSHIRNSQILHQFRI